MKFWPKTISNYLIKAFLLRVLILSLIISGLVFTIDLIEMIKSFKTDEMGFMDVAQMAFLKMLGWLQNLLPFITMIASLLTLHNFSNRSEITIMRASHMSSWQFLAPIILCAMLLGVFSFTILSPISAAAKLKYQDLEEKYTGKSQIIDAALKNGVWFRQSDENGSVIIHGQKINKKERKLVDISVLAFNNEGKFYQRITASSASFAQEGWWGLEDVVINREGKREEKQKKMQLASSLTTDFILNKIEDSFGSVDAVSFWELPHLINTLKSSGFSSTSFITAYHVLLRGPIFFAAIILISSFFALNHIRSKTNSLMLVLGIICGFFIYFACDFIAKFGMANVINPILAAWYPALFLLFLGILLVLNKEDG